MAAKKPLILSVDDDPDVLNFMKTVLEKNGYSVATAESAEDGLRLFKQATPALVFVDLMMEEVDAGTDLVRKIRTVDTKVPIYMLSSVGDVLSQTTDYTELGLKGMLQKPMDIKNLLQIAKAATGGK
jgi:DNA-binding response OmpR family regulator